MLRLPFRLLRRRRSSPSFVRIMSAFVASASAVARCGRHRNFSVTTARIPAAGCCPASNRIVRCQQRANQTPDCPMQCFFHCWKRRNVAFTRIRGDVLRYLGEVPDAVCLRQVHFVKTARVQRPRHSGADACHDRNTPSYRGIRHSSPILFKIQQGGRTCRTRSNGWPQHAVVPRNRQPAWC